MSVDVQPSDAPLRVVQWTSGIVGSAALRALIQDPRYELVGLFTHSSEKRGMDAGQIAGRPAVGVIASGSIHDVLGLHPDCVVYMPQWPDIAELERLLEAGINVVTTARLVDGTHYPDKAGPRLAEAAARGDATLLGTGMNPMFASTIAMATTAMCTRVRHVRIHESVDCGLYGAVGTWEAYGFGTPPDRQRIAGELQASEPDYLEALDQLAAAVGGTLDDYDLHVELATANEDRDLGFMALKAGTVSGIDARWIGSIDGEPFVEMRSTWKLGAVFGFHDSPDWQMLYGYLIEIEGDPNVRVKLTFMPEDLDNVDIGAGTAMPAINAIGKVCAAPAGVLGVADLPIVTGRRG